MGRSPCCDKEKVKKGAWSPEEDEALATYIHSHHGCPRNWISLPQKAGLRRCGKSCRLRWLNYLRPHIKRGSFTEEEDDLILSLYATIGSRWTAIAAKMPGRTDNDVKNHWNTKLKKKLIAGGQTPMKLVKDEVDINNNVPTAHAHFQQLYLPSFTSLLAQVSYNASPLGNANTILFDQFMFSSPPQGEQEAPHDQLVLSVKSEEAQLSTVSGSSSSLFMDQTDEYLAYPSNGCNILEDDLLLEDTRSLTFDQSEVYSDVGARIPPLDNPS